MPDLTEIEYIITNLKNNKAPGEGDIKSELLKTAGHTYRIIILNLRNMAQGTDSNRFGKPG